MEGRMLKLILLMFCIFMVNLVANASECYPISGFNVIQDLGNDKYLITRQVGWTLGACTKTTRHGCMNQRQIPLNKEAILYMLEKKFSGAGFYKGTIKVQKQGRLIVTKQNGFKEKVDALLQCE